MGDLPFLENVGNITFCLFRSSYSKVSERHCSESDRGERNLPWGNDIFKPSSG